MQSQIWEVFPHEDVMILGIGIGMDAADWISVYPTTELDYPLLCDESQAVYTAYYYNGYVPLTYVIDQAGIVQYREVGLGTEALVDAVVLYGSPDEDGDGFKAFEDCDDTDPSVYPCASEVCGDGIDQDCSGTDRYCGHADEVEPNDTPADADDLGGIGAGSGAQGYMCDTGFDGHQYTGDQDYFRFTTPYPGEGDMTVISLDWSGPVGDSEIDLRLFRADGVTFIKGDYVGKPRAIELPLDPGVEYVLLVAGKTGDPDEYTLSIAPCTDGDTDGFYDDACGGEDCDDADPAVNPDASEDCENGIDDDCDGLIDYDDEECTLCTDEDEDGFAVEGGECGDVDCDDADPLVYPGYIESQGMGNCADGKDNDCDGLMDALDPDCGAGPCKASIIPTSGRPVAYFMVPALLIVFSIRRMRKR